MSDNWDSEMDKNMSNGKSFNSVRSLLVTKGTEDSNRKKVISAVNWDGWNKDDCIFAVSAKGLIDALIAAYNAELKNRK